MSEFDKLKALQKFKAMQKETKEEETHWQPVSNIPVDEIYKDLPKAKKFHEEYVKMWLTNKGKDI